jgi:hypothetical protein
MMRKQGRATVIGSSELQDGDLSGSAARDPQLIRWKLKVGEDVYDEVSYNRMLDFVNNDSLPGCMGLTKSSDIKEDRQEVER